MIGEFRADKTEAKKFRHHKMKMGLLMIGIIWLFFLIIISLSNSNINDILFSIIGLTLAALFIGLIIIRTKDFSIFDSIVIVIEEDKIIRKGENLKSTTIRFKEIGRIIYKHNGIVIIKKGFWNGASYYLDKSALTSNDNIIFIPSLIQNYSIVKVEMMGVDKNKKYNKA